MSYTRPVAHQEAILEVKKSRFIAWIGPADSRDAALRYLADARAAYPDARHHCWAYVIGDPAIPDQQACSDDGEPSGTAGKPMLNVLQHKQVGDVMVVISRYFGGIKLGAGGLVRAYSQATQLAYEAASLEQRVAEYQVTLCGNFQHEQIVRHWLTNHEGRMANIDYSEEVCMQLAFPETQLHAFSTWLNQFPDLKISDS